MELYFGSFSAAAKSSAAGNLVTFTIPDIGVRFKAPFAAEDLALDYASLLTLLEFIEVNPHLFTNRALELYCHNLELVEQVNNRKISDADLVPCLEKALEYRNKLKYSINWISRPANPAQNPKLD